MIIVRLFMYDDRNKPNIHIRGTYARINLPKIISAFYFVKITVCVFGKRRSFFLVYCDLNPNVNASLA